MGGLWRAQEATYQPWKQTLSLRTLHKTRCLCSSLPRFPCVSGCQSTLLSWPARCHGTSRPWKPCGLWATPGPGKRVALPRQTWRYATPTTAAAPVVFYLQHSPTLGAFEKCWRKGVCHHVCCNWLPAVRPVGLVGYIGAPQTFHIAGSYFGVSLDSLRPPCPSISR